VQELHGVGVDFVGCAFPVSREGGFSDAVILKNLSAILVLSLLAAGSASASRNSSPGLPPGQAIKVTRADFKEKEEKEREREQRENDSQEDDDDSEEERETKRREREAVEAEREADRQAEAQKKAQAPEDFLGDVNKVVATAAPKTSSVNETAVQAPTVVAAAKKVVARRTR
jgi:hypothetical protein